MQAGRWAKRVPSLRRSSSYLRNNTEDSLDPLGGMEAARICGYCLQNSAHKVQVMDGLCPHGASKLWTAGVQMSKEFECWGPGPTASDLGPPGVAGHSAHTQGSLEDHRLQRT